MPSDKMILKDPCAFKMLEKQIKPLYMMHHPVFETEAAT